MQVGRSEYNALGVAAFLRTSLARGELLAVCECTPEQLPCRKSRTLVDDETVMILASAAEAPAGDLAPMLSH